MNLRLQPKIAELVLLQPHVIFHQHETPAFSFKRLRATLNLFNRKFLKRGRPNSGILRFPHSHTFSMATEKKTDSLLPLGS